jgi:glucose/arabinose dehydrogenase
MRWMRLLRVAALAVALLLSAVSVEAQLRSQVYASGFLSPVGFVQDPTDPDVQFVLEQAGRIRVIRQGAVLGTSFLDLTGQISTGGERGLLGLAFAPDYVSSARFFVYYTTRKVTSSSLVSSGQVPIRLLQMSRRGSSFDGQAASLTLIIQPPGTTMAEHSPSDPTAICMPVPAMGAAETTQHTTPRIRTRCLARSCV